MQGKMVAVFGDQDVGEQVGARAATFDRQRWHRRLHDRLAGSATDLRAMMHDPLEAKFQHFALIRADLAEDGPAAIRAGTDRWMSDRLARQVGR